MNQIILAICILFGMMLFIYCLGFFAFNYVNSLTGNQNLTESQKNIIAGGGASGAIAGIGIGGGE
jgi:hypothetical protein